MLWANPEKRRILFPAFLTNVVIKNRENNTFFLITPKQRQRSSVKSTFGPEPSFSMYVCAAYLCVSARDHHIQQIGYQPGKGTNPFCDQQNRENESVSNVGQIVTCET